MRVFAAYLLVPAILPLAAIFYSVFFARPPCPSCSSSNWAYALPALFFTYPAAFVIGVPTLRLLPVNQRSTFVGPPLAGAALALLVFTFFIYGIADLSQLALAAMFVAVLGAASASCFALLLGSKHANAARYTVRDYLPFFTYFLAVEGGAYFGQFSCGGYAFIRETFDLVFFGAVVGVSFYGRGFLTSVPRRLVFFLGTLVLFSVMLAISSTFYPGPPSSLGDFFKSFVSGLFYGPC